VKRILFVDLRNTARSQMAEAWFNQFADGWAKAYSCGTMPASMPDPLSLQVLRESGIDISNMRPKAVTGSLLNLAETVVLMGKDVFPGAFTPDDVWDFQDPTGKDVVHYRVQRDAIRCRIQELIVELQGLRFQSRRADWIHPLISEREFMKPQNRGAQTG
jgi:arsenate reductase